MTVLFNQSVKDIQINTESPEWVSLEKIIQARMEDLRDELEDPSADRVQLALRQGAISELRWLIDRAKKRRPHE